MTREEFITELRKRGWKEENSSFSRVKRDMTVREALQVLSLVNSSKRLNWPFDIKRLYVETFGRPLPTENHHRISTENSIDYDLIKDELFEKAVEVLEARLT